MKINKKLVCILFSSAFVLQNTTSGSNAKYNIKHENIEKSHFSKRKGLCLGAFVSLIGAGTIYGIAKNKNKLSFILNSNRKEYLNINNNNPSNEKEESIKENNTNWAVSDDIDDPDGPYWNKKNPEAYLLGKLKALTKEHLKNLSAGIILESTVPGGYDNWTCATTDQVKRLRLAVGLPIEGLDVLSVESLIALRGVLESELGKNHSPKVIEELKIKIGELVPCIDYMKRQNELKLSTLAEMNLLINTIKVILDSQTEASTKLQKISNLFNENQLIQGLLRDCYRIKKTSVRYKIFELYTYVSFEENYYKIMETLLSVIDESERPDMINKLNELQIPLLNLLETYGLKKDEENNKIKHEWEPNFHDDFPRWSE